MSDKNISIEELFNGVFRDASDVPSDNLWGNIEKELNDAQVDTLYKNKFKDDEVKPPFGIWFGIQSRLFIRQFVRFQATKLNAYYVGVVALLAGVGLYLYNNGDTNTPTTIAENTTVSKTEIVNSNKQLESEAIEPVQEKAGYTTDIKTTENIENTSLVDKSAQPEVVEIKDTKTKKNTVIKKSDLPKKDKVPTVEIKDVPKISDFIIMGREKTCKGSECVYTISGLNKDEKVNWSVASNAQIISQSADKIKLIWNTEGDYTVAATVQKGDVSSKKSIKVFVDKPVNPFFNGKTNVCQGSEEVPYSVSNNQDLGKQYVWEVKKNPFRTISNGYMMVNWNNAGVDTIILTDINLTTQCKSELRIPVFISKKPDGEITAELIEIGQYRFEFSNSKRNYKYKWSIESSTYNDETPVHYFDNIGNNIVKLEITDDRKCKNQFTFDLNTVKHYLKLINIYNPDISSDGLKPFVSSTLKSYRIEIFNAQNERIWESTKLEDGYPAEGWDGTVRGEAMPSGKYVCRINAVFSDGTIWKDLTNTGNRIEFTLLR